MNDVLSQDEIDALLGGVDDDVVDTETDVVPDSAEEGIRPYDLTSNDRVVRGRLATLEMIHERFARLFRVSVFNLLRNSPDVALESTRFVKYDEYVRSLFVPTSVNVIRIRPLKGAAYVVFDARLVFSLVDNFFGGNGRHTKIEGRDFTRVESRIVRMLLDSLFKNLTEAWNSILDLKPQYVGTEMNPSLVGAIAPTETVVVTRFAIDLSGGGGELHLTYPYSMLEPIRKYLEAPAQTSGSEGDVDFGEMLRKTVLNTTVRVESSLTRSTTTLQRVMDFREGQIIPIDVPEELTVRANDVPVFRARLGARNGNRALQILSPAQTDTQIDLNKLQMLESHADRRESERIEAMSSDDA